MNSQLLQQLLGGSTSNAAHSQANTANPLASSAQQIVGFAGGNSAQSSLIRLPAAALSTT
jgi:hypothetical protein